VALLSAPCGQAHFINCLSASLRQSIAKWLACRLSFGKPPSISTSNSRLNSRASEILFPVRASAKAEPQATHLT